MPISRSSSRSTKITRLRRVIKELEADILQLQITSEKLNGEGVNGLSYSELESLESLLRQGLRSVEDQQEKAEVEYSMGKIADNEVMGDEWAYKVEQEDFAHQFRLTNRRRALRHKARQVRLSSLDSQQQRHSPDRKELAEIIEILKCHKDKLVLWNQRMIGKMLDGMGYLELLVFGREIQCALVRVKGEMRRIKQTSQSQSNEHLPCVNSCSFG